MKEAFTLLSVLIYEDKVKSAAYNNNAKRRGSSEWCLKNI